MDVLENLIEELSNLYYEKYQIEEHERKAAAKTQFEKAWTAFFIDIKDPNSHLNQITIDDFLNQLDPSLEIDININIPKEKLLSEIASDESSVNAAMELLISRFGYYNGLSIGCSILNSKDIIKKSPDVSPDDSYINSIKEIVVRSMEILAHMSKESTPNSIEEIVHRPKQSTSIFIEEMVNKSSDELRANITSSSDGHVTKTQMHSIFKVIFYHILQETLKNGMNE